MRVAISGHRGLPADTERLVDTAIRDCLASEPVHELTGISCLADGADQLFARAVLDIGGKLEVIVPAEQYRAGLPADCWATYDELLAQAARVRELDHVESTEQSHMDASRTMLDDADQLYAVWDGKPARGYGGTADVVALTRDLGLDVLVIWPDGARRD